MATLLGPVLQFLGIQDNQWGVSLLVVTDGKTPPSLQSSATVQPFTQLTTLQTGPTVWRGGLLVPLTGSAQRVRYSVDGEANEFHTPSANAPPRMAYASCNGFSSPGLMKNIQDKNALWRSEERRVGKEC